MKYLDCVEIIVEKEKYAKEGVHKGMQGVVYFPGYGENPDIAEISVKESDMALLPNGMDARINESIKAQFDK